FRNSVLIGGLVFMVGYFLLTIHSLPMVFVALACLVVGNGFFKPNVSAMVGHLYPEGSALKDRAYNIFYMGINVGAFFAPLSAAVMKGFFGYHVAFAVAGFGMIASVSTLWAFRRAVEGARAADPAPSPGAPVVTAPKAIDAVPDWQRVAALLVIFVIVIVFWMVFHQNGTTLTYWAKENTDWGIIEDGVKGVEGVWRRWVNEDADWSRLYVASNKDRDVLGIVSNLINPFFVVTLSLPFVWFWHAMSRRGLEPATPTK